MRYVRIFLLHFQDAFEYRSISFVWFLLALLNPLIYLLFWRGAIVGKNLVGVTLTLADIASYYFLLIIIGAFLMVHIEEDVALRDIKEGGLVKYLMKPFSYFWLKFYQELPWRIIQGSFGAVALIVFIGIFGNFLQVVSNPVNIVIAIVISILAYFLSFVFKMIIGLSALWLVDYSGLEQLSYITVFVFAGFIIPLEFFHPVLKTIAFTLPFSYMIYFPVVAFQGKLALGASMRIIMVQLVWLSVLSGVYAYMWRQGKKKFSGVGQ